MSVYEVESNLKHDGALYRKGEKVELPDEVAEPLIDQGVLYPLEGKEAKEVAVVDPAKRKEETKKEKEAREAAREAAKPSKKVEEEEELDPAKEEKEEKIDLSSLTKKELLAEAKKRGVEVKANATNAQIIEALSEDESEEL